MSRPAPLRAIPSPAADRSPVEPPAPLGLPPVIGLEHLVSIGVVPSVHRASQLVKTWPPEVRVRAVGRRVLLHRDRVLALLGLSGTPTSTPGGEAGR